MHQKENYWKIPVTLLISAAIGLIATMAIAAIAAMLIEAEKISENSIGIIAMVAILFGAVTTALAPAGKMKQMRLGMCLAAAAVYLLVLMCCAAIVFDGVKGSIGASAAVVFGGAMAVYLLGMNHHKKPKYKMPKLR